MKVVKSLLGLALASVVGFFSSASAATLTQWNFNSVTPDANTATGILTPNIGSGSASLVGGTTSTFASGDASGGSTDPALGDDSAWNLTTFASAGTENKGRGAQFSVSTVGFEDIIISFDQRLSNTAANTWRFQYTLDGNSYTDSTQFTFTPAATLTGDVWYNNRSVDLSAITGADNNANFGFRIVAEFDPNTGDYLAARSTSTYGTSGTSRFDMVTISATAVPEPTAYAAIVSLVCSGIALQIRRRKKAAFSAAKI